MEPLRSFFDFARRTAVGGSSSAPDSSDFAQGPALPGAETGAACAAILDVVDRRPGDDAEGAAGRDALLEMWIERTALGFAAIRDPGSAEALRDRAVLCLLRDDRDGFVRAAEAWAAAARGPSEALLASGIAALLASSVPREMNPIPGTDLPAGKASVERDATDRGAGECFARIDPLRVGEPDDPELLVLSALCDAARGIFTTAAGYARRTVELSPDDHSLCILLVYILYRLGRFEEAVSAGDRMVAAERPELLELLLARCEFEGDRPEAAHVRLEERLGRETRPSAALLAALAALRMNVGRLPEALDAATRAEGMGSALGAKIRGDCATRLEEAETAIAAYRVRLAHVPGDQTSRANLVSWLLIEGRIEEAREALPRRLETAEGAGAVADSAGGTPAPPGWPGNGTTPETPRLHELRYRVETILRSQDVLQKGRNPLA